MKTAPGAHHYRLVGLEIRPGEAAFLHNLVEIGWAETSSATVVGHHRRVGNTGRDARRLHRGVSQPFL